MSEWEGGERIRMIQMKYMGSEMLTDGQAIELSKQPNVKVKPNLKKREAALLLVCPNNTC